MSKVEFFTPINFAHHPKSCSQSLVEYANSYFYLGGKKATVIPGHKQNGREGVVLTKDSPRFLITALKVLSYLTVILPILFLIVKAIYRSMHKFHVIDVRQKLNEGIEVSSETLKKIEKLIPKIRTREKNSELVWYQDSHNFVFGLSSVPDLIFKIAVQEAEEKIKNRFKNMVQAQKVCLAHQLDQLVVPHAKVFELEAQGKKITILAEERLSFPQDESAQEKLYQTLPGLDKAIEQLTTFIAKTAYSDVTWRNLPVLNGDLSFQGPRRIGLIDLEETKGAAGGIFGAPFRRGLIGCLFSEKQLDIALAKARYHGIFPESSTPEECKKLRMKEITSYFQLQKFYETHRILENPNKPIQVEDLNSLGLDLEEEEDVELPEVRWGKIQWRKERITMRQLLSFVISKINKKIEKAPEEASPKGKRHILLNINRGKLQYYKELGIPREKIFISQEEEKKYWLRRIMNALVEKGYLFELEKVNGHGYFIQA